MSEPAPMCPGGRPLELLYERAKSPGFGIPVGLAACYGGDLGFPSPRLYANFVASIDGVVALRSGAESGSIISGRNPADRFVMGLLRACAEAVVVGAGTFRLTPGHLWHAEHVYPAAASQFAELRARRRLPASPLLVLVSASGELDAQHPALRHETLVVTTAAAEGKLRRSLPGGVRFAALDRDPIPAAAIADVLRAEGLRIVLTEGGPSLIGGLLEAGLLDELFLTISPMLLGRHRRDGRKGLVEGVDLLGSPHAALELLGARRHGSHLFLRYGRFADSAAAT